MISFRQAMVAVVATTLTFFNQAHASGSPSLPTAEDKNDQVRIDHFEDWRVVCPDAEKARTAEAGQGCQMLQSASIKNDKADEKQKNLFLLTISRSGKKGDSFAVITVPVGVYLAPGIQILVDRRRPFKVLYEICGATACHAGFKLSGRALRAFKRGNLAKFRVWVGRDRVVDFPVSLKGFTRAFTHFRSETSR